MDLTKTNLNLAIVYEKEYNHTVVATCIVEIWKDLMGSNFLTGISAQSYYGYVRTAMMILRYFSIIGLVESLIPDDTRSERLRMSHLNDIGLYTATTEELPILITVLRNSLQIPKKPAQFHASTFYTSAKMFLDSRGLCSSITVQAVLRNALRF